MCVICSFHLRHGADLWDHLRAVLTHTSHRGSPMGIPSESKAREVKS